MSMCLWVSLSARISPESHARSLPNFCACSSCPWLGSRPDMFTTGHIAYRRKAVFFHFENALSGGKGDGSARRGRSVLSTISLFLAASLLRMRLRLRSIVMSAYVCLSVHEHISGTARAIFTTFLCVLPMAVARSSSGMLTIGRIAYRWEGVTGVHRGRSVIYDCLVSLFLFGSVRQI